MLSQFQTLYALMHGGSCEAMLPIFGIPHTGPSRTCCMLSSAASWLGFGKTKNRNSSARPTKPNKIKQSPEYTTPKQAERSLQGPLRAPKSALKTPMQVSIGAVIAQPSRYSTERSVHCMKDERGFLNRHPSVLQWFSHLDALWQEFWMMNRRLSPNAKQFHRVSGMWYAISVGLSHNGAHRDLEWHL